MNGKRLIFDFGALSAFSVLPTCGCGLSSAATCSQFCISLTLVLGKYTLTSHSIKVHLEYTSSTVWLHSLWHRFNNVQLLDL